LDLRHNDVRAVHDASAKCHSHRQHEANDYGYNNRPFHYRHAQAVFPVTLIALVGGLVTSTMS
jgi:hypothetical protein